jgi:DNA-directed RNA polymerase subunit RPC12/RpoP
LKLNQELVGHSDKVVAVAFFRHGRAVATASEDHTARIWDVETGKERMILRGHSGPVDCVVASPDDAMIATAGRDARDSTVRLWDVNTGAEVAVLGSNPDAVRALAFTADGKFLAAAAGKTILFWDVHTRQVAARLAKQSGVIPTLAISPDGLYLANGSPFGLVLHAVQVVDDDAGANTWQEYVQSFKGLTECPPGWVVKAEENEPFVRFEPDGLRVSLPAGRPGNQRGTGVSCWQAVKGDFEITFNFEILHEPAPKDAGSPHTRVSMEILLERPKPWRNAAAITRKVTAGGTGFACWSVLIDDEDEAKEAIRNGGIATAAKTGRLRLKRAGALLSYYVAEGFDGEFTLLRQFPFGKEPLKEIRLVASTGGPKAAIDVRITDLLVRAESLPDLADIQPVAADPTSDGLWLWTGILLAAAVALSLGIWRYVRRRRAGQGSQSAGTPAPGAEMVSLACGTCGRALRAAATDLGKKLKCPHCGGAVASNKPP